MVTWPPGWMGDNDITVLANLAKDSIRPNYRVLEVGCFLGRSTLQWVKGLVERGTYGTPTIHCVDLFEYKNIPEVGRSRVQGTVDWNGDMLSDFVRYMNGYNKYISPMKASFPKDIKKLPLDSKYEVIFLDTERSYENMSATLSAVLPYVNPVSTVLCGAHYNSEYAEGVVKAVNEVMNRFRARLDVTSNIWKLKFLSVR